MVVRIVGAIIWYDNFYLLIGFLPGGVGGFLTTVARVEYKDWVPFLDAVVLAEVLKRLDDRRSGGLFVEQCAYLMRRNTKSFYQKILEFFAIRNGASEARKVFRLIVVDADDEGKQTG